MNIVSFVVVALVISSRSTLTCSCSLHRFINHKSTYSLANKFSSATAFAHPLCNNARCCNDRNQQRQQQLCRQREIHPEVYGLSARPPKGEGEKFTEISPSIHRQSFNIKTNGEQDGKQQHMSDTEPIKATPIITTEKANNFDSNDSNDPYPFLSVVLPLLFISISNQWSRSSLYYLVDFSPETLDITSSSPSFNQYAHAFMNIDLNFTAEQYGFLASAAFTSLFALASLYAGKMADTHDRRILLVSSSLAWSIAALSMSISHSYNDVIFLRSISGLACAFAAPASYTLLRDLVPRKHVGTASATYGSGVYLGESLASLSILTGGASTVLGWRGALAVAGVCGILCATLVGIVLPEDKFGNRDSRNKDVNGVVDFSTAIKLTSSKSLEPTSLSSQSTVLSDASAVLSTSNRVRFLFLAVFFRFCAGLTTGIWSAPFFRLAFPDDASSYAIINAMIIGVCGVASGMIGGWVSDRLAEKSASSTTMLWDESTGRLLIPIFGAFLAIPIWHMTMNASTFEGAMFWLAMKYLVAECWFGPAVAVLQSDVPSKYGGTAQGMFTLTGAMGNIAPSVMGILFCWTMDESARGDNIVGMIAENVAVAAGGNEQIMLATLLDGVVGWAYLLSGTCFVISALSSMAGQTTAGISHDDRESNEILVESKELIRIPVRVTDNKRSYMDDKHL